MKKMFKKVLPMLLFVVFIPCFMFTAYGCGNKITNIKLTCTNNSYYVGDVLKPEDFTIVITYKDKTTENIVVTNNMLPNGLPTLNNEGNFEVKVNYDNKEYTITVNATKPASIISATFDGCKVNYETYDEFVANGTLKVVYENNLSENISITQNMITQMPDMTVSGEKEIAVAFANNIYTYTINVIERQVVSYTFENVTTTYHNTIKEQDISINGGKIKITYSNNTTQTIDLTNDMILELPEIEIGNRIVVIAINNVNFELPIEITINPEVLEYQKLLESIRNMLENGLDKNTTMTGTINIDLTSRVMNNVKEIKKNTNKEISLDSIDDKYLNAISEGFIKALLENSSNVTFEDFVKELGSTNFDVNVLDLALKMIEKFVTTNNNFDFYTYIEATPYLKGMKDELVCLIAEMINEITFNFDMYNEELNYTQKFKKIIEIVETTIYKPLITKQFDGKAFLNAYKSFAESYSKINEKLGDAVIKQINALLNTDTSKHALSEFLRNSIDTYCIHNEDLDKQTITILYNGYADILNSLENFFIDNNNPENIVTLKDTISQMNLDANKMLDDFIANDIDIPVIAYNIYSMINILDLCASDQRYIPEVFSGFIFNGIEDHIYLIIDKKYEEINMLYADIDYCYEMINYYIDIEDWETIDNIYLTIDELNCKITAIEYEIENLYVVCDTCYKLGDIATKYISYISFDEEIDFVELGIDILNATGNSEIAEQVQFYADQYKQTGATTLLQDISKLMLDYVTPNIEEYFGSELATILSECVTSIAQRIDNNNIIETPLNEDLLQIVNQSMDQIMELQYAVPFETMYKFVNYVIDGSISLKQSTVITISTTTKIITKLIINNLGFMLDSNEKVEVAAEGSEIIENQYSSVYYLLSMIDNTYCNPASMLAGFEYLVYSVEHQGEAGMVYNFFIDTIKKYADMFNSEIPEPYGSFINNPNTLISNIANAMNLTELAYNYLGLPVNDETSEVNAHFDNIIKNLDVIVNGLIYNLQETEEYGLAMENLNREIYNLASFALNYMETNEIVLPFADTYQMICDTFNEVEGASMSKAGKLFINEIVEMFKDVAMEYAVQGIMMINPDVDSEIVRTTIYNLINDVQAYYLLETMVELPDYENYIVTIVNLMQFDENNPYYPVFINLLKLNDADNTLSFNDILNQFADLVLNENKELIINTLLQQMMMINPELNVESAYVTLENLVTEVIGFYFEGGEVVDYLVYAQEISSQLGLSSIAQFVQNYIDFGSPLFVNTFVGYITDMYYALLGQNYVETELDMEFKEALNELTLLLDTYHLEEDKELALMEIKISVTYVVDTLGEIAKLHNNYDLFVVSEFANVMVDAFIFEMTDDVEKDIETIMITLEILPMLGEINIENYLDVKNAIEKIIEATIDNTITTQVIINAVTDSKLMTSNAILLIATALGVDEQGYLALEELINYTIDGYKNNNTNLQEVAEKYFDFVDVYGGENTSSLYALGIISLVYVDTDKTINYNTLLDNIPLPDGIASVDYNVLINNIITKEFIKNAITINGIDEVITYNEQDKTIEKQELSISVIFDFDITFIVFKGNVDLKLEVNYQ